MEKSGTDIPKLFGKNVQKYRKSAGLTQSELAKRLDITQKHLSIIETGTQFASANLIGRISEELNISPASLFGDDINQDYMDALYQQIEKHIDKKMAQLAANLMNEISRNAHIYLSKNSNS